MAKYQHIVGSGLCSLLSYTHLTSYATSLLRYGTVMFQRAASASKASCLSCLSTLSDASANDKVFTAVGKFNVLQRACHLESILC